jgi:RNA polymerase sigma factor (sigma-70 family)
MSSVRAGPQAREQPPPELDVRQPSDQELLARYAARGDEEAFARLVERHGKTVWSVCRRLLPREPDAEDAFQAVFVVLARKAAAIRNGEAVGSWLYGVAYRTAMKARRSAACRESHERQAGELARRSGPAQAEPWGEAACHELLRLLDEEVQRLGAKHRAPFVLCCLEGMSKAEAARELGWREGTVSGRLARARKILQKRFARRGVALSAVLTATALAESASAAPAGLLQLAARGAPLAGKSSASPISPAALQLAEAVLRTLRTRTVKVVPALLLALLLLLSGGILAGLLFPSDTLDPDLFIGPGVVLGTPINEEVLSVAFAPDGKRLLTAGGSLLLPGQIQMWEVASRKHLTTLRPLAGVHSLSFAPSGQTFATADFQGDIKIRDAATGEERAVVRAHDRGASCVAFAPDGISLLSAGLDRTVKLWQTPDLVEQRRFLGHDAPVLAVAFFHHSAAFVSGAEDGATILWDQKSGLQKRTLRGPRMAVESVAVSPNDKLVACASRDGTVRLWSAETGAEQAVLDHGDSAVHAVAFSRDGKLLGSAAADGKVRLWDVPTRKLVGELGQHKAAARAIAFSPDGALLASGSLDNTARLWPLGTGDQPATLLARSELVQPILALAYSPHGDVVAMATTRPEVQIRDAQSGDVLRVLKGHTAAVSCLAFSPDGLMLASGSSDRTVRVWDWESGQQRFLLESPAGVHALAFTRDGKSLAAAGSDGVLRVLDPVSGEERKGFTGHEAAIHALAAAPVGHKLATGGADQTIRVWDLSVAKEPLTLKGHTGPVRALAFSAKGVLASAGDDGLIKLWEPAFDRVRLTLSGHEGAVTALAFTPSGRTLASAGRDHTVRIWDSGSGELRTVLRGHKKPLTALAMHPRGKNLVSGGLDTVGLRWRGAVQSASAVPQVKPTPRDEREELKAAEAALAAQLAAERPQAGAQGRPAPGDERAGLKAAEAALAAQHVELRRAAQAVDPAILANGSGADKPGRFPFLVILAGLTLAVFLLAAWIYLRRRRVTSRLARVAVRFDCASCGKHLKARGELAGTKVKCPACRAMTTVPAAEATWIQRSSGPKSAPALH